MKVKGLDNKEYVWTLKDSSVLEYDRPRSKYHVACKELLKELFPCDKILEEVPLVGSGRLTFDFFLPLRKMAIEVQGQQHTNYSAYFHEDVFGYLRSKKRDNNKVRFCKINNIYLAELYYDEDLSTWKKTLCQNL